jgi:uncharacterized membrane protein YgcG
MVKALQPKFGGSLSSEKVHASALACQSNHSAACQILTPCSPIVTYGGKGVAKLGVIKSQHAIAFTAKKEPSPTDSERPRTGEGPMLPGIRISPVDRFDKVDQMARIDFARTYTVEHNVKVYDFGTVAKDYMDRLAQQWIKVLLQDDTAAMGALARTADPEDSEEEEEDDEESESEDDKKKPSQRKPGAPASKSSSGSGGGSSGGGSAGGTSGGASKGSYQYTSTRTVGY